MLVKNNLSLKLRLILGTKDFIQNDYIGLINNDEKEDLKNEIKSNVSIPGLRVKNQEGQVIIGYNNPEDFRNMIRQNMGKPIPKKNV